MRGHPEDQLKWAFKHWKITHLFYESDTEDYAEQRDSKINLLADEFEISVNESKPNLLFDQDIILKKNGGKVPIAYKTFTNIIDKLPSPPSPLPSPSSIPPLLLPFDSSLLSNNIVDKEENLYPSFYSFAQSNNESIINNNNNNNNNKNNAKNGGKFYFGNKKSINNNNNIEEQNEEEYWKIFSIPTMKELGYEEKEGYIPIVKGGESNALKILANFTADKKKTLEFEKPKTNPALFDHSPSSRSTTLLSPYLKFGCLSVRTFYHAIQTLINETSNNKNKLASKNAKINNKNAKKEEIIKISKPPESLIGQLYWREFFYLVSANTQNFHQMKGNKICMQINWDNNKEYQEAWASARTGYPWIDAIMTQLINEGTFPLFSITL